MTDTGAVRGTDIRGARLLPQIAGFIFYLLAVQALVTAGVGLDVYVSAGNASDLLLPAASILLAASYAILGFFLRRTRVWARNFAVAFAAVSLLAFPVGTVLGGAVLVCIALANRAGAFASAPRAARRVTAVVEDSGDPVVLRLEPELAAERIG